MYPTQMQVRQRHLFVSKGKLSACIALLTQVTHDEYTPRKVTEMLLPIIKIMSDRLSNYNIDAGWKEKVDI